MNREQRKLEWKSRQGGVPPPAQKDEPSGNYACSQMSTVEPKKVDWLWKPYLPIGKVTLLDGWPGIGKSYITCQLSAIVSRGGGFPNSTPFEPGNVLMFNAEDGLADTLRPRLEACGADLTKIYCLDILHKDGGAVFDQMGLLRFESTIIDYRPKFVIVDPLFAFTGAGVDIHRANESRAVSSRLAAIAARYDLAMLCVRHLNKGGGGGSSMRAGIGSIDWIAAARVGLLAGCDPDDQSKMALTNYKNNLAKKGDPLGYRIDFDPEADQGTFVWTGISDLTADRILAPHQHEGAAETQERADAREFLYELLKDGPVEASDVEKARRAANISDYSMRQAKTALKVKTRKEGGYFNKLEKARWMWEIDPEWPEGVEASKSDNGGLSTFDNQRLQQTTTDNANGNNRLAEGVENIENQRLQAKMFTEGVEIDPLQRLQLSDSNDRVYPLSDTEGVESPICQRLQFDELKNSTPSVEENITPKDWKSPF